MTNKEDKKIKAGGIVLKEENGEKFILLVYRKKENDWSFPKGHVESGEEIKATVIRELEEETGLKIKIVNELMSNEYINNRTGDKIITHMFLLWPITFGIKPEHEGDKVEWVKLNEVEDRLSYGNLKEYFSKIIVEL